MTNKNKYPVALFLYKRSASTLDFLERIKAAGITKVYVFADGPKTESDRPQTDSVRNAVMSFITDNPNITCLPSFAQHNLGLKQNIIQGLNLVFAQEEGAIILEDDCLPSPDFFTFTMDMLDRYQRVESVMSINGTSLGQISETSYSFSKYSQCWGWATWARAWQLYDPTLRTFNHRNWQALATQLELSPLMRWYFGTMLKLVKVGQVKTWDFQWSYAHFKHRALAIVPAVNLVQNIGFDNLATNTKVRSSVADMRAGSLSYPLVHPEGVRENLSVSRNIESHFYLNPVAILGLLRQSFYYWWRSHAHRS